MIAAGAAFKLTKFSCLSPGNDPFFLAQSYGKQSEVEELVIVLCIQSQRNTWFYIAATLQLCGQIINYSFSFKIISFVKNGFWAELSLDMKTKVLTYLGKTLLKTFAKQ